MAAGIFVTGTDTGVGKTAVARLLVHEFRNRGQRCAAMKPVASGAVHHGAQLRNDDALQLQAATGLELPYSLVNPYVFEPAIAPHIAAARCNTPIELDVIQSCFAQLQADADCVVVEGVGGWLVPLGPGRSMADVAVMLRIPVVLVVGLRLGCLNHALLTQESIALHGGQFAGWIANTIEPDFQYVQETVATLQQRITVPCLGVLPNTRADFVTHNRGALDMTALMSPPKTPDA